jgi:hypothetical protein
MIMPGARIERMGTCDLCHAYVRYAWRATTPHNGVMAAGTNYCELDADGRLRIVIGFWDAIR